MADWHELALCPGDYVIVAALYESGQLLASWENAGELHVIGSDFFGTGRLPNPAHQGHMLARARWSIREESLPDGGK